MKEPRRRGNGYIVFTYLTMGCGEKRKRRGGCGYLYIIIYTKNSYMYLS
jgi:hypothetical protein